MSADNLPGRKNDWIQKRIDFIDLVETMAYPDFGAIAQANPDVHPFDLEDMLDDPIMGERVRKYGYPIRPRIRPDFGERQVRNLEQIKPGIRVVIHNVDGHKSWVKVTSYPYLGGAEKEDWKIACEGEDYIWPGDKMDDIFLASTSVVPQRNGWNAWNWLEIPPTESNNIEPLVEDMFNNPPQEGYPYEIVSKGKTEVICELPLEKLLEKIRETRAFDMRTHTGNHGSYYNFVCGLAQRNAETINGHVGYYITDGHLDADGHIQDASFVAEIAIYYHYHEGSGLERVVGNIWTSREHKEIKQLFKQIIGLTPEKQLHIYPPRGPAARI